MKHYFEFLFGTLGFGFAFAGMAFMGLGLCFECNFSAYYGLAFAALIPMSVCMLISSAIGNSISRDFCNSLRK